MADTLDILTIAEGRAAVKIGSGDTSQDTDLAAQITAVSRRLDQAAGPIVVRTITDELHDGGCDRIWLQSYPITSFTTVTEYDGTTGTVLTAETVGTEPSTGYLADRYGPNPALYSGCLHRRSGGSDWAFSSGRLNVKVTYVAGRYATTAVVDERFKQAGRIMLQNLWRAGLETALLGDEYDVPAQAFPGFAIPNAVRQLLAEEWQDQSSFA